MRKFHRITGRRKIFFKSLETNLIMTGKMETTVARAKEVRPRVERLITIGKRQNLAGFRILLQKLPKKAAQKLFYEIAPRYKERRGGYVRIMKTARQDKRDGAHKAIIEFV